MKENLIALIQHLKPTVQSKRSEGSLRLYTIPLVRSQCLRVKYGPTGIHGNASQIFHFEKQLVHQNDLANLIQELPPLRTKFSETAEVIIAETGMHSGQAVVDLYKLLLIIINEELNNSEYNDEIEDNIIEDFMKFVLKTPVSHRIQIWISTLIMKTDDNYLDNDEKFYIRKPMASDYHINEQLAIEDRLESDAPGMCSAIIETKVVKFWPELHEWESFCGRIINSLRLFSNIPIVVLRVKTLSDSKFQHSFDFRPSNWPFPTFLLSHFTVDRLANFREFYSYIQSYISSDTSTVLDDGHTPHPFDIGYHWYNVALISRISTNGKIAALISCLEALYAIGNFELRFRLSQYCAFHLSLYGHSPLNVVSDIGKAYDIRSHYYHGGDVRSTPDPKRSALLNRLLHYCKLSVSLLLPLKGTIKKSELLELFPKAILDSHSKRELLQRIAMSKVFQY